MTTPTEKPAPHVGKGTDWEALKQKYRSGTPSIRRLAEMYGTSEGNIRKTAKRKGWTRDLSEQVQQKVRNDLLKQPMSRTTLGQVIQARYSDKEVIELAAASLVQVIREHRSFASRARDLAVRMLLDLEFAMNNPAEMEQSIIDACSSEEMASRMSGMFKAIGLPSRAAALKTIVESVQKLVLIERQSFGLADNIDPTAKGDDNKGGAASFVIPPLNVPDFLSTRRKVEE